ncbi:MAG: hypothetical protein IPM38_18095 [Ignavibacteria bacterium]|nr:hypothetical protein [Ignavibacteria bacterium]
MLVPFLKPNAVPSYGKLFTIVAEENFINSFKEVAGYNTGSSFSWE